MTQDDLLVLHHLRAAWAGGVRQDAAARALAVSPGRAGGRVAAWGFARAAEVLARGARRPLRIGQGLAPSADEARLIRLANALSASDRPAARAEAAWLVKGEAVDALMQALSPAACALQGNAAPRLKNAARA